MADTDVQPQPIITGTVAFYKKPEPLSLAAHGKLGVKRTERAFQFAKSTTVVPILTAEFAPAGVDYPIIFSGADKAPLAVMGMANSENLFIRDDGGFEIYRYIPAFIRRYPFVFAEDAQNKRLIACIDVEAPMVAENAEVPLFNGSDPTPYTKEAISFLTNFEQQRRDTLRLIQRLTELDLFETIKLTFNRTNLDGTPAEPANLGEYVGVSQTKLMALPADTLLELHQNGILGIIYIHLHSLRNWQLLIQRASDRAAMQQGIIN